MYCRNCGNEVNEKAIGCPKCGLDPRTEKNFCPGCGTATNEKQVVCTSCGISVVIEKKLFSMDTGNPSSQTIDVNNLVKNPALIAWIIALISFFLPWIKVGALDFGRSISGVNLGGRLNIGDVDTILIPFLLYMFPVAVLGMILSFFVQDFAKYTRYFLIGAIVLMLYIFIGALLLTGQERGFIKISTTWGLYVALFSTLAGAYFSGLFNSFIKK